MNLTDSIGWGVLWKRAQSQGHAAKRRARLYELRLFPELAPAQKCVREITGKESPWEEAPNCGLYFNRQIILFPMCSMHDVLNRRLPLFRATAGLYDGHIVHFIATHFLTKTMVCHKGSVIPITRKEIARRCLYKMKLMDDFQRAVLFSHSDPFQHVALAALDELATQAGENQEQK